MTFFAAGSLLLGAYAIVNRATRQLRPRPAYAS